jgi:hypothetical protein
MRLVSTKRFVGHVGTEMTFVSVSNLGHMPAVHTPVFLSGRVGDFPLRKVATVYTSVDVLQRTAKGVAVIEWMGRLQLGKDIRTGGRLSGGRNS